MALAMNTTNRWQVVAATIRTCLEDVNMRQADLVRESGLSDATVRSFMSGRLRAQPTPHTLRKLERALLWPVGAVDRILAGEDPDRVLEVSSPGEQRHLSAETERAPLQEQIDGLVALVAELALLLQGVMGVTHQDATSERSTIARIVAALRPPANGRAPVATRPAVRPPV